MGRKYGTVVIRENICKGCDLCVVFCPEDVLEMSERTNYKGYSVPELVDEPGCTGCKICGQVCPEIAIDIYRFTDE
jgi:2-oxoglutarate ferredoxin oxidoreductase subunit delta